MEEPTNLERIQEAYRLRKIILDKKSLLEDFAVKLRMARKHAKISRQELAKRVGISVRSIQYYEERFNELKPKKVFPPFDTVLRLAAACNADILDLIPQELYIKAWRRENTEKGSQDSQLNHVNSAVSYDVAQFGEAIANARKEKDMTQAVLAEKAGCSVRTVYAIERGKYSRLPRLELMVRLTEVCGLNLWDASPDVTQDPFWYIDNIEPSEVTRNVTLDCISLSNLMDED